jgi:hypothetical protein
VTFAFCTHVVLDCLEQGEIISRGLIAAQIGGFTAYLFAFYCALSHPLKKQSTGKRPGIWDGVKWADGNPKHKQNIYSCCTTVKKQIEQ